MKGTEPPHVQEASLHPLGDNDHEIIELSNCDKSTLYDSSLLPSSSVTFTTSASASVSTSPISLSPIMSPTLPEQHIKFDPIDSAPIPFSYITRHISNSGRLRLNSLSQMKQSLNRNLNHSESNPAIGAQSTFFNASKLSLLSPSNSLNANLMAELDQNSISFMKRNIFFQDYNYNSIRESCKFDKESRRIHDNSSTSYLQYLKWSFYLNLIVNFYVMFLKVRS